MTKRLDMTKIARGLGAERRGPVRAEGGYFGAMGLVGDVEARFRIPAGGGRPTDPQWTERRLVALAPETLRRLATLAAKVRTRKGIRIGPMQLASLLLEKSTAQLSEEAAAGLLGREGAASEPAPAAERRPRRRRS